MTAEATQPLDYRGAPQAGDLSASPLWNPDLAPVPASGRKWGRWNFAALWISMAACIPTYMLASSLIGEGMKTDRRKSAADILELAGSRGANAARADLNRGVVPGLGDDGAQRQRRPLAELLEFEGEVVRRGLPLEQRIAMGGRSLGDLGKVLVDHWTMKVRK